MSRQANPTLIGGFVVGAIALGVAAVLLLARGDLLTERLRFVLFFEGSVKGLNVGAPVVFRGVKIGEVVDIQVEYDTDQQRFHVPVFIEVDPTQVTVVGTEADEVRRRLPRIRVDRLIERGLRGQLVLQSFLTGQLWVLLDFFPDKPARLLGAETIVPEIPTVPTAIQELTATLEQFPIEQVLANLSAAMASVHELASAPELMAAVRRLDQALVTLDDTLDAYGVLARRLDAEVAPLAGDLERTMGELRGAIATAERTLAGATTALAGIDRAAGTADAALGNARLLLAEDSPLVFELTVAARELAEAARSVRALADTLERQPESILRGKR